MNCKQKERERQRETERNIKELHGLAIGLANGISRIMAGHKRISEMSPQQYQEYEVRQTQERLRRDGVDV